MEPSTSTAIAKTPASSEKNPALKIEQPIDEEVKKKRAHLGGLFKCNFCPLEERYDYKGENPPFAKKIFFSECCYVMEDPWNPRKKGQFLVLGGDCSVCKNAVCLGCSIFYAKRFCRDCANQAVKNFPLQLHSKIKNLQTEEKVL